MENKKFYAQKFEMLDALRASLVTAQSYVEELNSHEHGANDSDQSFLTELEGMMAYLEEVIPNVEGECDAVQPMVESENQ